MTAIAHELTTRPSCQPARASLRAYVRAGLAPHAAHRVSAHLECCRSCTAIYLDLVEATLPRGRTRRASRWTVVYD